LVGWFTRHGRKLQGEIRLQLQLDALEEHRMRFAGSGWNHKTLDTTGDRSFGEPKADGDFVASIEEAGITRRASNDGQALIVAQGGLRTIDEDIDLDP